jgi:hypothetical protein
LAYRKHIFLYMAITSIRPAQALRTALKAAGFNARRVSVREYHNTLRVTVRDVSASLSKVTAIAAPFERVSRCETTGEILCGGNIFVNVRYTKEAVAPVKAAILVVLDSAPADQWVAVLGNFRAVKVSREGATYNDEVRMDGPGLRNSIACGVTWAAERLAIAYLDASAQCEGAAV